MIAHRKICLLTVLALLSLAPSLEARAQVVVIAHESVPIDTLGKADLLKLFSGKTEYWQNNLPVIIVDMASKGDVRDSFYAFLGKTSSRMRSIWLRRKLTGEGELPASVETEELLFDKVASTEGAIGFASIALLENYPSIKVLIADIPMIEDD